MTAYLISGVSDTWQCENVGFPWVELSKQVHAHLLHWRIEVHHLVSDSQLVNIFLHIKQYSGAVKCDNITITACETSLSCSRQTCAMHCITPTMLSTKVDTDCDKLKTDDHCQFIKLYFYHTACPPKLITLVTVNVQLQVIQVQSLRDKGKYPYF